MWYLQREKFCGCVCKMEFWLLNHFFESRERLRDLLSNIPRWCGGKGHDIKNGKKVVN